KNNPAPDPTAVEVEIGIVSRVGRDVSNYSAEHGVLSVTNLGHATPQLLTGLGFLLCDPNSESTFCKHYPAKSLGAFVSMQFASGSDQTISGYSLGGTIGLGQHLRALVGFSLTPVNEITPGFAIAASQYVAKNQTLFPGINPSNLSAKNNNAFDGIQWT